MCELDWAGWAAYGTPAPPPTNVLKAPQSSVTDNRAVKAPAAVRVTITWALVAPAGRVTVWPADTEAPLIVIVALVTQWARQDRKVASRGDRHAESDYADDELEAYNAMLRELARMRR